MIGARGPAGKRDQVLQRMRQRASEWLEALGRVRVSLAVLAAEPARALRLYRDFKTHGLRPTAARISRAVFQSGAGKYRKWVELYDTISPQEFEEVRRFVATLSVKPKFSILVPIYETPEKELRQMIASVEAQIYDDWELCIADDASKQPHVRRILETEARAEPRVKLIFREENGNICAASNSALTLASGDFVALLDHDDIFGAARAGNHGRRDKSPPRHRRPLLRRR